jgi:hypothetical protein
MRAGTGLPAALDLGETDAHRVLLLGCLCADTPTQVDGLKSHTTLCAELAQLRKDAGVKSTPLGIEVGEGGTDEQSDDRISVRHALCSCRKRRESGKSFHVASPGFENPEG